MNLLILSTCLLVLSSATFGAETEHETQPKTSLNVEPQEVPNSEILEAKIKDAAEEHQLNNDLKEGKDLPLDTANEPKNHFNNEDQVPEQMLVEGVPKGRSLSDDPWAQQIAEDKELARLARRLKEFHQLRRQGIDDEVLERAFNARIEDEDPDTDTVAAADEHALPEARAAPPQPPLRRRKIKNQKQYPKLQRKSNRYSKGKTRKRNPQRQQVIVVRPTRNSVTFRRYRPSYMEPLKQRPVLRVVQKQRSGQKNRKNLKKRRSQMPRFQKQRRGGNVYRGKAQRNKKRQQIFWEI